MAATSKILQLCCIFITGQVTTGQELLGATEMRYYIPRENWYSPNLSPVSKVPVGVNYDSISCSIVDSFVDAMMTGYTESGAFTEVFPKDTKDAFNSCKKTVCDHPELLEKLTEPLVAAEFASMMATLMVGSRQLPKLDLFRYVVDPTYWEILKDVSFPVVEEKYFYEQSNAAFEIISKVCGHQKATLKAKLGREVVNWIFLGILIDEYIPGAFSDSDKEELATETDAHAVVEKWLSAESRRSKDNVCLDLNVAYSDERRSIGRIRYIAKYLGVECGLQEKEEEPVAEGSSEDEEGSSEDEEGSSDHEEDRSEHEEGSSDYEEGSSEHEAGSSDYEEGRSELEEGSSEHEDGSSDYEDRSDEYGEGKSEDEKGSIIVPEYEYASFEYAALGAPPPSSSITSDDEPPPSSITGGGGPPSSGILGK